MGIWHDPSCNNENIQSLHCFPELSSFDRARRYARVSAGEDVGDDKKDEKEMVEQS